MGDDARGEPSDPPRLPDLTEIRRSLRRRTVIRVLPDAGVTHASVALVLHEPEPGAAELLFIERATREGDAWSGHVAFPGGMRGRRDRNGEETSVRECFEEVGVALAPAIARLDDDDARQGKRPWPLVISPFVFEVAERPALRLGPEVHEAFWVPLSALVDPASAERHRFDMGSHHVSMPAVRFDRFTIWGLTYRILGSFLGTFGRAPAGS